MGRLGDIARSERWPTLLEWVVANNKGTVK